MNKKQKKVNKKIDYAGAFLAVLLLIKNAAATPPNIATRIPMNITVSLMLVPNIGVPDP